MLVRNHYQVHTSIVKWIVLILAAMTMIALLATTAAGATGDGTLTEPRRLDPHATELARPMNDDIEIRIYEGAELEKPVAGVATELWMVLQHFENEEWDEALEVLEVLPMPNATREWKFMAMAVAHMRLGDLPAADRAITLGNNMAPATTPTAPSNSR